MSIMKTTPKINKGTPLAGAGRAGCHRNRKNLPAKISRIRWNALDKNKDWK